MDSQRININVCSEIGKLEHVLVHTPGAEIENMSPETAQQYLYSDILSMPIAQNEHHYFKSALSSVAHVHEISDMLADILEDDTVKSELLNKICQTENVAFITDYLMDMPAAQLASMLIQGVHIDGITFHKNDHFTLLPLPNLFFMRDASFTMFDNIMISHMTHPVRSRETIILESIYANHPLLRATVVNPVMNYNSGMGNVEGGDVQIVRDDIILCGLSSRTNMHGIESLSAHLKTIPGVKHLICQELPESPESFIHLDMTFTMLDRDKCMVYEPVIMGKGKYRTFHIVIDNKDVSLQDEDNIPSALNKLGIPVEPISCGGGGNSYFPAREQWHSGANFFSFAPGKVIGYARNLRTIEELNKHGFDVVRAEDIVAGKDHPDNHKRCVVTIEGSELCRGGGGARCMTMPISRQQVEW